MKFNPDCTSPQTCEDCENKCINDIAFLYGLPASSQNEIIRRALHKTLQRGEYVFREGQAVDSIVIIKRGRVKLNTYDADGRENIIGIFSDNDTIWEGIFAEGRHYPYSAVCLEKTHLCYVNRADVEEAVGDASVALKVINMLSDKLHDANERNMILSINEPMKRIAAFLLYIEKRSEEPLLTLRLDDIAGSVGLRPETVSRYIRKMVSEGLIEKIGQSGFRIPDFERLNALVEE